METSWKHNISNSFAFLSDRQSETLTMKLLVRENFYCKKIEENYTQKIVTIAKSWIGFWWIDLWSDIEFKNKNGSQEVFSAYFWNKKYRKNGYRKVWKTILNSKFEHHISASLCLGMSYQSPSHVFPVKWMSNKNNNNIKKKPLHIA